MVNETETEVSGIFERWNRLGGVKLTLLMLTSETDNDVYVNLFIIKLHKLYLYN